MITSTSNTQIKNVINLIKKSKDRKAQGLFVVEGKRMFEETPRERIHSLFVSESYEKENRGSLSGYDYETVSDEIFSHMSAFSLKRITFSLKILKRLIAFSPNISFSF